MYKTSLTRTPACGCLSALLAALWIALAPSAGESLSIELRLLAEAGLTPYEALRTATWNAARALGETERAGRIAPGYRADLILVDGDPLADAAQATTPYAVIAAGRVYGPDDLAGLLKSAANPPVDRTRRNVMSGLAAQALPTAP